MTSLSLFPFDGRWHRVSHNDVRARDLADRHYSRQTVGADDFTSSGRKLVLLSDDARAVWAVVENLDPAGGRRWRCTIFRNEGAGLSSSLILEATQRTYAYWTYHYAGLPRVPLTTEVDPGKTRAKRDPGRCFRRAGWHVVTRDARGLVIFQAPDALLYLPPMPTPTPAPTKKIFPGRVKIVPGGPKDGDPILLRPLVDEDGAPAGTEVTIPAGKVVSWEMKPGEGTEKPTALLTVGVKPAKAEPKKAEPKKAPDAPAHEPPPEEKHDGEVVDRHG